MDFVLVDAFGFVRTERCQACGLPLYLCHSSDDDIQFMVNEETCQATRARDKAEDKAKGKDGKGDTSGKTFSVEPYSISNAPLDSFRPGYWQEVTKIRKERIAALPGRTPLESD